MPVLKDFACFECGDTVEIVTSPETEQIDRVCTKCGVMRLFASRCNGGMKSRYRFCDTAGLDDGSHTEYLGVKCGTMKSDGVTLEPERYIAGPKKGQAVYDSPRFSDDERLHRQDKRRAAIKRKRGKVPIMFDQKSRTSTRKVLN